MRVGLLKKDSDLKSKNRNLWFIGLYIFVLEPLINTAKYMPFLALSIMRVRSLKPLFTSLRDLRYILSPNSRCSLCGQKVKHKWIRILECYIDSSLDENAKPFDPAYISCKYCDSFLNSKSIYGDLITEEHGKKLESWRKWEDWS